MPIQLHQFLPANVGQPGYTVAKELARQTVATYGHVRLAHVGIGPGSCCAALAVNPAPNTPAVHDIMGFTQNNEPIIGNAQAFGAVLGNSQLAQGGLDLGPLGGHAERAALTAAGNYGATLYLLPGTQHAVLFVELTPCGDCSPWLNGQGGGVANPFNGIINGGGLVTLNVWWRWVYPGNGNGLAQMNAFHAFALWNQLNDINVNW